MRAFHELLAESAAAHGHLCPGQVVGVRMALLGCRLIGLDDPRSRDQIKKLIVYVEMDRCTADAVAYVTGARLGRRSLKFADYGIMAATFVHLESGAAYRVISTETARDLVPLYAPGIAAKAARQIAAYKRMPDSVLFQVQQVQVPLCVDDLPGPTRSKTVCVRCGQLVRDGKQVAAPEGQMCKPCAQGAYFQDPKPVAWEDMNWWPPRPNADIEPEGAF